MAFLSGRDHRVHHIWYCNIATGWLVAALALTGCTQTPSASSGTIAAPPVATSSIASTESATGAAQQVAATTTVAPSITVTPPTSSPPPSATAVPPTQVPTSTPRVSASATPSTAQYMHIFPVRANGKVSYGRYHHDYPAADIFCPIGSQFVAVTDGVVDYVSHEDVWDPKVNSGDSRGGLSVAIIGDDGVRYYGSHLSQVAAGIAPGVRVHAGQLLGLTGKSGDARYVQPHLHFGISHPTSADDWAVRRGELQPYPYLKAWQQGQDVMPKVP